MRQYYISHAINTQSSYSSLHVLGYGVLFTEEGVTEPFFALEKIVQPWKIARIYKISSGEISFSQTAVMQLAP